MYQKYSLSEFMLEYLSNLLTLNATDAQSLSHLNITLQRSQYMLTSTMKQINYNKSYDLLLEHWIVELKKSWYCCFSYETLIFINVISMFYNKA